MAIKFDMSKAFDQVEWAFLSNVMLKLDFQQHWVDLIMRCVQLGPFFFSVNGVPRGHIISRRGVGHGGPLFPFLF